MTSKARPPAHRSLGVSRSGRRASISRALLLGSFLLHGGCEPETSLPLGPPGCEPVAELDLERALKSGFRALAEGDAKKAAGHFAEALQAAPGQPEALLGARMSAGRAPLRTSEPPAVAEGAIDLAGEARPVGFHLDRGRLRFEELAALAPLRRAHLPSHPVFDYFRARGDAADAAALARLVDLVVLHDTHTQTAREAFAELESKGGSTHFIIDWDGTIHQTLDLVLEANHTGITAQDRRSVSIDLVNPVDATRLPPLHESAQKVRPDLSRPMSEPRLLQGEEVLHWGYTRAQLDSLSRLVRALASLLPMIPLEVPAGTDGVPRHALAEPLTARGIVGHFHLFPRAQDPGAGFPWEAFGQGLRR